MDRYQSDVPRFNGAPHYASAAPYHTEHPPYESRHGFRDPDPRSTHAYLVGGGIASLAAAASLIHDANIPAAQVHILESSTLTGGSMDGAGSPETGYILRGGRMLNFSYRCLYELLSTIPSLTDPKITVMDEINMFNAVQGNRTHANARIVKGPGEYSDARPRLADASDFGLSVTDRMNLLEMTEKSEKRLGRLKIEECFSEAFFHTNFWIMWATM
jgi:oleate hydratase